MCTCNMFCLIDTLMSLKRVHGGSVCYVMDHNIPHYKVQIPLLQTLVSEFFNCLPKVSVFLNWYAGTSLALCFRASQNMLKILPNNHRWYQKSVSVDFYHQFKKNYCKFGPFLSFFVIADIKIVKIDMLSYDSHYPLPDMLHILLTRIIDVFNLVVGRSMLFSHCECPEEGTRNVVSECLGKLTLIDPPNLLSNLKQHLSSQSPLTRSTVVTAIKFTISDQVSRTKNRIYYSLLCEIDILDLKYRIKIYLTIGRN